MDWERAKTLIIVFLALLNVFLGAMLLAEFNRQQLGDDRIKAIQTVLAGNGVKMNAPVPRDYRPRRQLAMGAYQYDANALAGAFFAGLSATRTDTGGKTVFQAGQDTLTIQQGYLTLALPEGGGSFSLSKMAAITACDGYMKKWQALFPGFTLDTFEDHGSVYKLAYRQVYQKTVIYTNYLEFTVTEKGVVEVDGKYAAPQGFTDQPRDIFPADEVMYAFMQQVKNIYDTEITVVKIDLVYCQNQGQSTAGADAPGDRAVPCYRIVIDKQDIPFLWNAYTNTMM